MGKFKNSDIKEHLGNLNLSSVKEFSKKLKRRITLDQDYPNADLILTLLNRKVIDSLVGEKKIIEAIRLHGQNFLKMQEHLG